MRLGDLTTLGTTYVTQSQTAGPAFTLSESGGSVLDTISTLPAGSTASFSLVVLVSSSTSNGTWLSDSASVQTDTTLTGSSVTSAWGSTTVYDFGTVSVTNPGTQSSTEGNSVSLSHQRQRLQQRHAELRRLQPAAGPGDQPQHGRHRGHGGPRRRGGQSVHARR